MNRSHSKQIDWVVSKEGCWECSSHTGSGGYPRVKINGKQRLLHRIVWELDHGRSIPENLVIMHLCDNPKCINPAHLQLGTAQDNRLDADQKGRSAHLRGEDNPKAKLTWKQARAIRKASGNQRDIAKRFHVSQATVFYIKHNLHWTEDTNDDKGRTL